MNGTIKAPLIVLGATGAVGRGVVQAAVAAGRPVIAVARDRRALKALQAGHPQAAVTTLVGSVANDAEGARLADALRDLQRPPLGVVAAICGRSEGGRLLDRPAAFLQRRLDEDLLPHLAAARHLLPLLAEADRGGSYVLIGGPGSEHPWAGHGHRSIGEAALRMLARVLHDEARALSVRVQLLSIPSPVCTDYNRDHAGPQWPSALAVGQRALAMAEQRDGNRVAQPVVAHVTANQRNGGLTSTLVQVPASPLSPAAAHAAANDGVNHTSTHSDKSTNAHKNQTIPAKPLSTDPDAAQESPARAHAKQAHASQEPERKADLLPARCLQDARTLLQLFCPSNRDPHHHQEAPP